MSNDFDFDTKVARLGVGTLKEYITPKQVFDAGLISYSGAEFEFRTAPAVIEAVVAAAKTGLFGFTVRNRQYIDRVQWWLRHMRRFEVEDDWIVPTQGTIFSVATTIRAFTSEEDAIIVTVPSYYRYAQAATRTHRRVVESALLERDGRYELDFADLERKFAYPRNKMFVLCHPNNPTGTVWSEEDLHRIADLAKKYDVIVFSDEIFAEVVFCGHEAIPFVQVADESVKAITCTSLGKVFSFTGVNHANVIIRHAELRHQFIAQRDADHYGSIDPMLHAALVGGYTPEGAAWVREMRDYIWGNYKWIAEYCAKHLPGVSVYTPQATYVLMVDFRGIGLPMEEIEPFLTEEALFVADPMREYGGEAGIVRMNLAVPRAELMRSFAYMRQAMVRKGILSAAPSI